MKVFVVKSAKNTFQHDPSEVIKNLNQCKEALKELEVDGIMNDDPRIKEMMIRGYRHRIAHAQQWLKENNIENPIKLTK